MIRSVISWLLLVSPLFLSAQSYKKLHSKSLVADTHNDILTTLFEKNFVMDNDLNGKTHSDLDRFKKAGVDVQVFSIWCHGLQQQPNAWANRQIDTLYAVAQRNPNKMQIVYNSSQLQHAVKEKKLAALMGVEGGHMIEDDINQLDSFYKRGVRYMTLTWNNSTSWATSAADETYKADSLSHKGLTDVGRQVVKRMNELGMMVDISHVGEQTFWDAINTSTKPVIASHSSVYSICPHPRNLKDEQIKSVAKNGGVIFVNFYSGFLDSSFERRSKLFADGHKAERDSLLKINPESYFAEEYLFKKYADEVIALRPPLSLLIDHIDHIAKLAGVDHVGLGSDFDGVSSLPQQLNDITSLPLITKGLLKRGYSKKDIRKILGENFLRVLKANESH